MRARALTSMIALALLIVACSDHTINEYYAAYGQGMGFTLEPSFNQVLSVVEKTKKFKTGVAQIDEQLK